MRKSQHQETDRQTDTYTETAKTGEDHLWQLRQVGLLHTIFLIQIFQQLQIRMYSVTNDTALHDPCRVQKKRPLPSSAKYLHIGMYLFTAVYTYLYYIDIYVCM